LRISRPTLNRWVAAGRIRRLEIGPRTVRYPAEDIAALIDIPAPENGAELA
jgi:excisionase family DNA binding protein